MASSELVGWERLANAPVSFLISLFRRLLSLSIIRSSAAFGLSGAAFAMGTLLLARSMPVEQFGELSLMIALYNIFCLLTPAGIDQIAVRHQLSPSGRLLVTSLGICAGIGVIVSLGVSGFGALDGWDAVALGLAVAVGGMVVVASGLYRAAGNLGAAVWIFTGANWGLLMIGVAGQGMDMSTSRLPFTLFLLWQAVIAVIAWVSLMKDVQPASVAEPRATAIPWREAPALLGMAAVGTIALQLERVMIPSLIDLAALATFSVLASVAIFPFRVMTAAIEFSLTPRLRAETCSDRRRYVFWRELWTISGALVVASALVFIVAPWITIWITDDKYELSVALLFAACINGAAKFVQTIPRAVLTACGTARDLSFLNYIGWLGLALAVLGGFVGVEYGLAGVIIGVALGTMIGNLPAFLRAWRAIR